MQMLGAKCWHCGLCHTGRCQLVKAIEYHSNGTLKRVEYHSYTTPPQTVGTYIVGDDPNRPKTT